MLSAIRGLGAGRFPLAGVPLSRLTRWINLLLVVLLTYTLAQLTWLMLQGSADNLSTPPVITAKTTTQSQAAASLETVAALHLLGRSDAPVPVEPAKPIEAPETRLNLTLRGLIAVSSQQSARAIISQGSGDELTYKVGDTVPGGAKLHEILADRVMLERSGRFETLTLPKETMEIGDSPARNTPTSLPARRSVGGGAAAPSADPRQLSAIRDTVLSNPQDAMKLINAQPVMEGGKLKGYRVNPGRDRQLFNSVGLRPGDIVTSVNGITLNDMSQMGALFQQLTSAPRLDVTIERRGQQTQLSLALE